MDDHPYNRLLVQQQLEQLGCHVQLASNGQEGLAACLQGEFDVVLSDVHMPVMDGYAFTRSLREAGVTVPVIGLTASVAAGEAERCQAAGMNGYLCKPISLAALTECLRAALPRRLAGLVPDATAPAGQSDNGHALLVRTLKDDLDELFRALTTGQMGKLRQHAHRMRGAVAHMEGGEALADVCRDLETGAQQALDAAQALVEDLKLYLEAYLQAEAAAGEPADGSPAPDIRR